MSKLETLERETEEERDRRVCLFVGVKGEREKRGLFVLVVAALAKEKGSRGVDEEI